MMYTYSMLSFLYGTAAMILVFGAMELCSALFHMVKEK